VLVVQSLYLTAQCRAAQTSVLWRGIRECSGTNPGP